MASKKRKKLKWVLWLVFLFCVVFVFYAPRFLLYASDVKKADAIVVLLGPDFKARQREAYGLIDQGMARYLIIPAYNRAFRIDHQANRRYLLTDMPGAFSQEAEMYPAYYEDTHLEILKAQKILTRLGLQSAIFVSSPFHMRRIQIMVSRIFGGTKSAFYFVPTRYEKAPANIWEFSAAEWKKMRREYGKILWFLIYSLWPEKS